MTPRPLLLTPPAPPGVSLPGLVAASARLNVLGDVKSTLRSIGLSPGRPGYIAGRVAGREEALAARLGCPVSVVDAAATPFLDPADTTIVRWGGGAMRRLHLEFRSRRVSPTSLATSPHHRAAWLNRLLDYCPESLELLVDTCSRCGRSQRWLAAEGIGCCDEPGCGPLDGSGETLPQELETGYRRFAAICSPDPVERASTLADLPPELATLPPVTLTDLTLKIGLALEGLGTSDRAARCDLSPIERSRSASRGATALRDWPHGLRSEIRAELGRRGIGNGVARRELRTGLLSASHAIGGGAHLRALLMNAVPEMGVEIGRAFAGMDGERLLGSVAARRLGTSHARLRRLSLDGIFQAEGIMESGGYRRALYDANRVDAAADAWRMSAPVEALMRRLALPRYACERIVGAGDVERETHPFVLTLAGQPRIRSGALDDYVAWILSSCLSCPAPAGAVRLDTAMKVVGGRLKPWRQVLDAIGRGSLPAWRTEADRPVALRILVIPTELERFAAMGADEGVDPAAFRSPRQSQMDAVTVLNLRQIDGPRLSAAGVVNFENGAKSLLVGLDDVLRVARRYVATAEAAARLRLSPSAASHLLKRRLGPASSPAGWSRATFDEHFSAGVGGSG